MTESTTQTDKISISIQVEISLSLISDLLVTALEGGSNYWIESIEVVNGDIYSPTDSLGSGGWNIIVNDVDEGSTSITFSHIKIATQRVANDFPSIFKNIITKSVWNSIFYNEIIIN